MGILNVLSMFDWISPAMKTANVMRGYTPMTFSVPGMTGAQVRELLRCNGIRVASTGHMVRLDGNAVSLDIRSEDVNAAKRVVEDMGGWIP